MRAREADAAGFVESGGVKVHYEVYERAEGAGGPTLLLTPAWMVVHKRFWKAQVPYLARHFRVVTFDGPGNGLSDRPLEPAAYEPAAELAEAVAVLDATGTDRAVVVGLSMGGRRALQLAAERPDRVLGVVAIGAAVPLLDSDAPPAEDATRTRPTVDPFTLPASRVPLLGRDPVEHWSKLDPAYWTARYEDFLWFFFGQCFPEAHTTKQVEDAVSYGLETQPEVLTAQGRASRPTRAEAEQWCRAITAPVLVIHGDRDRVSPLARGERIAELTGGELVTLHGSGHIPLARDPVKINHLIRGFAERFDRPPPRSWAHGRRRPKKVLYLSSPIGLGHARRDVAVARALRERHEDVQVDWLAQHPVTRVLEAAGERVHPASRWLASESGHIEEESGEHDLHAFEAIRRMDEVLVSNFMVFDDVVRDEHYDLVIGDEAWEVDHFLHENPELKRFGYVWLTDFVGFLPMPDDDERRRRVAADYNAEVIEHVERYPRVRDRAIFVGNPRDVVPDSFGPDLPQIRDWTERHYDFSGYITGIDPGSLVDRGRQRAELGWGPDDKVCVVTVGGSGVGAHLLRRVGEAYDAARARVPGLRMVVVTGPRLDADVLAARPGLEVHTFVPDLYRHLAACDLAVVQGGLSTTMELTAAGTPFVYVPLRHHFEQNLHVRHRLEQYAAGRCMPYDDLTPDGLAAVIADEIGRETAFRPVEADGADRAADLVADLL